MTISEYKRILCKDRERYMSLIHKSHCKLYIFNAGYKLTVHYRRCKLMSSNRLLKIIFPIERLVYHHLCIKYGCDIPSSVNIGEGLKIDHPCGIVINSNAIIGNNFNIKSGAVIGKNGNGVPIIGNNVMVGVHSIVLGNIHIGDNVDIGAGAIVTHDVPKNGVVYGKSAEVHRIKN